MNGTIYRAPIRRPRPLRRVSSALRVARQIFVLTFLLAVVGIGAFLTALGYVNG